MTQDIKDIEKQYPDGYCSYYKRQEKCAYCDAWQDCRGECMQ